MLKFILSLRLVCFCTVNLVYIYIYVYIVYCIEETNQHIGLAMDLKVKHSMFGVLSAGALALRTGAVPVCHVVPSSMFSHVYIYIYICLIIG